ncbi:AP2/ERF domain-containing protein [Pycnococcus provasolii]
MSHDARPTANHANHANDEAVLPPFPTVPSLKRTAGTLDDMTNKMMKDDVVYLASVAKASKRVASRAASVPPPPPPPLEQSAQPSSPAIAAPTAASSPGYRGVSLSQKNRVFQARIWHNKKDIYVGQSTDAKEAAFMRDRAWRDLGKDPSQLNFDDTVPIPNEYLASIAYASKMVATHAAGVPLPPPSLEQIAQPSSQDAVQV